MRRVYHNFMALEEYRFGMWRIVRGEERRKYIKASAALMMDVSRFYDAMARAVAEWPMSCEHNLTADSMNQLAWMGHAGCCIAVNSPEDCTRAGWYHLNDAQMVRANQAAADAIMTWQPTSAQMVLAL